MDEQTQELRNPGTRGPKKAGVEQSRGNPVKIFRRELNPAESRIVHRLEDDKKKEEGGFFSKLTDFNLRVFTSR